MSKDFIIRTAKEEDAEKILDYSKQVGSETDFLTFGAEGLPYTVAQEQMFIAKMRKSPNNCLLVAWHDEEIVGLVSFDSDLRGRTSHCGSIGVSVLKKYWGQGIGKALIEKCIEFAKQIPVEIIRLEVHSNNHRAIKLYQKLGFEKFGTFKKAIKVGEEYFDTDYMALYL